MPSQPPRTKGEHTHARLREAAAAEFARRGFHATKVSDIVKASGLTQPTFYSYFDSKEAAYEELVGEFRRRLEALISTMLIKTAMNTDELLDSVATSFLRFFDFLAQDPDLTQIGFFQPPGCTLTKAGMATWIGNNIAKEQQIGLFRTDVPADMIGKCFVGMVDQMAREPVDARQRQANARHCALLLCEGLWTGVAAAVGEP
ncbi:HTH-type transcriptional regulator YdgC [Pseudomonas sp. M47T1]|uniref:TetR/AcrR family transcriptional regulator n=1 Tax=unclassified Pseudomonas TaxID=196821 RepID=UPI0002607233|nr:TetR/AcrR family transcriptional regulator [Pseudomonas sp. M47T1]EIK97052.1 HTH-type transcriptional regulator YdgC [Pseudomonas sp. M47T1]